jgi:hypothetical protein
VASDALLNHSDLSPEAALVLCCATTAASPARTATAAELSARVRDWDRVADIAKRHAVLPLVHRYLKLECPAALPEEGMAKLQTPWQMLALYNRHLAAELVRLMDLLKAANLAAVAFKGPVLAAMAYGSIDLRQYIDLDILIRRDDLPRVAEILTAEGYVSPHIRREGLMTGYFQEYEDAFFATGGLGAIDVHWKVTSRAFRFAPDEESMWQRAQTIDLAFGSVNAIAPEDLLLYLCVHAAKHGWVTLGGICDVAETIRSRPGIDLKAMLAEATALGSRRMFLTGIRLAHDLVGAPVTEALVSIARSDRAVSALATSIARGLFGKAAQRSAHFDPWAVPIRSIEGAGARAHYIAHRILVPTMGDYELMPLPTALFPLYWLIRPFRMVAQYGPRLFRGPSRN